MTDEQRKRIHDITYSTDDRAELAERIVALEEEVEKQKFKFEVLKAHGIEIVDAVGGGHEIYDTRQRDVNRLEYENAKLRELVAHYEYAVTVYDARPSEVLEWSVRCDALRKELGIEEDA